MARRDDDRWHGRPFVAFLIRTAIFLVPILASVLFAWWLSRVLPSPEEGDWVQFITWWVVITIGATAVLWGVDRLARKALPLAALYRFSLVFPDKAPSRYKVARRSGNLRDLDEQIRRARDEGLGGDRTAASETVLRLVAGLSRHDRATRGHSERVRVFTDMLAEELDLDEDARNRLRWAALLHDVGKMTVHADILNKPGKPTEEEWKALKSHPEAGARITAPLHSWLGEWAGAIEEHHEKYDGSGYPHGRAGTDISWGARIVAVSDAYDTMTAARAYKRPMAPTAARHELAACAGSHFDPVVVRAFLNLSLGRLRLAAGPLSWLAQSPLLNVPTRLAGLVPQAAAMVTLGVATVAGPAVPGDLPDLPVVEVERPTEAPSLPPVALPTPQPTPQPTTSPTPAPPPEPTPTPTVADEPAPILVTATPEPDPVVTPDPVPVAPVALAAGYTTDPAPGSAIVPGQMLTLTLTVVNPSSSPTMATANVLSVSPISGAPFVAGSATLDGRALTGAQPLEGLLLPDLAPGASAVVVYRLTVDDVPSGTLLTPVASLRSNAGDLVLTVPGGYRVEHEPDVTWTLASDAPSPLKRGDQIVYTAVARNGSAATGRATGLVASLPAPGGTTYVPGSARVDGDVIAGSTNPFATARNLAPLPPGGSHTLVAAFRVADDVVDGTTIAPTAGLRRDGGPGLVSTTEDVVDVTTALSTTTSPSPPTGGAITPGTTITYRTTFANGSGATAAARGLSLDAPTPSATTFVPGSAAITVTDPSAGSTTTTYAGMNPFAGLALPPIPVGGSVLVTYRATLADSLPEGTVVTAPFGVSGGDAVAPVRSVVQHTVTSAPVLGLDLAASVPEGDVVPGQRVRFTATLSNTGDAPATGLTYRQGIPAGGDYVAASATYSHDGAAPVPVLGASNPFEDGYTLPVTLEVGETLEIVWSADLPAPVVAGTDLSSTGTVTATEAGAADTRSLTYTALGPDVGAVLRALPSSGATVVAGTDTITYELDVTVAASPAVDATDVVVTLPTPAGATYVPGSAAGLGVAAGSPTNPFDGSGRTVTRLPADGVTRTFAITVTIDTPVADGTVLTGSGGADPFEIAPLDAGVVSHTVSSGPAPTMSTSITPAGGALEPGEGYTVVVDLANGAGATERLSGVLRGTTPADSLYDGASVTIDGVAVPDDAGAADGNPLVAGIPFGPLDAGESLRLVVTYRAAPGTADGTSIGVTTTAGTDQVGDVVSTGRVVVRVPTSLADTIYLKTTQPGVDSDPPLLLPLSPDAPTQTVLPAYTTSDSPGLPGHVLDRRGGRGPVDEDEPARMQHFGLVLDADTVLNTPVRLRTWAHVERDTPRDAKLDAVLLDCAADLSDCVPPSAGQVIAIGSVELLPWGGSSTGFVETVIDFGTVHYDAVAAGRALVVKVSVDGGSDDDLVLAYDTDAYPSALELDTTASPAFDITATTSPVDPVAGDRIRVDATIEVRADSPAYAETVTLDVGTPTNGTYVPGSATNGAGAVPADPIAEDWTLPTLMAPGDTVMISFEVDADSTLTAGDEVTIPLTVAGDPGGTTLGTTATATISPDVVTFSTLFARATRHGDTAWVDVRPLSTFVPTQTGLPDQDADIDGEPGLLLKTLGSSPPLLDELDPGEYAAWLWTAPYDTGIAGPVTFDVWAQIKDGVDDASAQLQAELVACDVAAVVVGGPDAVACTSIASATSPPGPAPWPFLSPSGGFEQHRLDFGSVSTVVPAGTALGVKLGVSPGSDDDVWVASDTTTFPTRLDGTFTYVAPALGSTLWLHDDSPGDGLSSSTLPMDATPPTASTPGWQSSPASLPDRDVDGPPGDVAGPDPGMSLTNRNGIGLADMANRQIWTLPVTRDTRLQGPVTVELVSAVEGFSPILSDNGRLDVQLGHCATDGTSCVLLGTDQRVSTDWHPGLSATWTRDTFFPAGGGLDVTVPAGRVLVLEVSTTSFASRDMLLAYDSVHVDARMTFGGLSRSSMLTGAAFRPVPWPVSLDLSVAVVAAVWWRRRHPRWQG